MTILWLLFVPMLVILAARLIWPRQISITEAVSVGLVCAVLIAGAFYAVLWSNRADHEIRNGEVISKAQVKVSCEHCRQVCSGSHKARTCRTVCDHSHDYDWVVRTTVGELTIARVDRRGTTEPPRFTSVIIGEPAAMEYDYQNYILGAANTIFKRSDNDQIWAPKIPGYPRVHDYYRVNRVLTPHVHWPQAQQFNDLLNQHLRTLGPREQVNLVVIVTRDPQEFTYALENSWVGGKKNDVVIVYGVDDSLNIKYVRAFTFANSSGNENFIVKMRDELVALKSLNDINTHATKIVELVSQDYQRKSMSDFEYLAAESEPSGFALAMIFLLGVVAVAVGLIISYHRVGSDEWRH